MEPMETDMGSYQLILDDDYEIQINIWYYIKISLLVLLCIFINAFLCYIDFGLDSTYSNDQKIVSYSIPAILLYSSSVGILKLIPFKYIYIQYNDHKMGYYILVLLYMLVLIFLTVFDTITLYEYNSISSAIVNVFRFVVFQIIFAIVLKCLSWEKNIIDSCYSVLSFIIAYVGFFIWIAMKILFPKFQGTIFFVLIIMAILQVIGYKKNKTIHGSFLFCIIFTMMISGMFL